MSELLEDIYVPQTHVVESILEEAAGEEEPDHGKSERSGQTSDPDQGKPE